MDLIQLLDALRDFGILTRDSWHFPDDFYANRFYFFNKSLTTPLFIFITRSISDALPPLFPAY
jgi:hypothetical protein